MEILKMFNQRTEEIELDTKPEPGFMRYRRTSPGYQETEHYRVCCICGQQEWTGYHKGREWASSQIDFLCYKIQYCPSHSFLRKEMDRTLRQTFSSQALEIVQQVADRIVRPAA